MRLRIAHQLDFRYSAPVTCEPLAVRLRPRCDGLQHVIEFHQYVEPAPAGRSEVLDLEGNAVQRVWFSEAFTQLRLGMSALVQIDRSNPFDFLLDPVATTLPVSYSSAEYAAIASYFAHGQPDAPLMNLVQQVRREVDEQTVPFLTQLAATIRDTCEMTVRETGDPWPPEQTLSERRGSCRDLAVLYNACCRLAGFPARFVSGYQWQEESDVHALHAWSEVYLPGAGWRGFDPSFGLAVLDAHVVVATSAHPAGAAPTSGSFRGNDISSTLEAHVQIQRVE